MSSLDRVREFVIPSAVIAETIRFLRTVGIRGCEGFVLWAGKLDGPSCTRITRAIVPDQQAMETEDGLLVVVGGDALFKANKSAHERGEILCAQVHTHPTNAYHSSTDDDYPLVTMTGALSVVIPDFATKAPRDIDQWAWYRLVSYGKWAEASDSTEVTIE